MFNLTKEDDVRKYVIRREIPSKKHEGKVNTKAPKIQRLVTPLTLQRKRHLKAVKRNAAARSKEEAAAYATLLAQRIKEKKEKRAEIKRSSSRKSSSA